MKIYLRFPRLFLYEPASIPDMRDTGTDSATAADGWCPSPATNPCLHSTRFAHNYVGTEAAWDNRTPACLFPAFSVTSNSI